MASRCAKWGPDYLKVGAIAAIYHFGLQYAQKKGFTKVDLGWSRAFLTDGALRYKRKMGTVITGAYDKAMALKLVSSNTASRSFLRNNPFIVENEYGLCGAVFVQSEAPPDEVATKQMDKDYGYPGLVKLSIYSLPQDEPLSKPKIMPHLPPNEIMQEDKLKILS